MAQERRLQQKQRTQGFKQPWFASSKQITIKQLTLKQPEAAPLEPLDSERSEKVENLHFPFILNDRFGYITLVLTDGCYQILVPSKPECSPMKNIKHNSLSALGLTPHSGSKIDESETFSASRRQDDSHSILHMEDSSPITFHDGGIRRTSGN